MEAPLVSVLIPARNAARWIATTLDSVLAQTWRSLEIIVVDDASTDGTNVVLAEYAPRGVRTIASSEPLTAAAARNRALRESRGAFVKFLDADDVLSPECIALQVERIRDSHDCVASAAWARFRSNPEEARFVADATWRDLPGIDWLVESMRDGRAMMQCGMFLVPRALLDVTGGWDERLTLIDDFEFFTRVLSRAREVRFANTARLYYRSGDGITLSASRGRAAAESALAALLAGASHVLAAEDSARVREVAANALQAFVYANYPEHPDLRSRATERIRELGGATIPPDGPPAFQSLRRFIGWKLARRVERFARQTALTA